MSVKNNLILRKMNSESTVKTDFVAMHFENGVIIVDFRTKRVTLEQAKQIVDLRLKLIGNNSFPILVDGRNVTSLDKESRNYFAGPDAKKGVKAGAILIDSTFNKFLGNFFLKVTYKKEKLPTMIFTDRDSALNWLYMFK